MPREKSLRAAQSIEVGSSETLPLKSEAALLTVLPESTWRGIRAPMNAGMVAGKNQNLSLTESDMRNVMGLDDRGRALSVRKRLPEKTTATDISRNSIPIRLVMQRFWRITSRRLISADSSA